VKDGVIVDDFRIRSSLPTIERVLRDRPARVVIVSHFGRPVGRDETYSWQGYLSQIIEIVGRDIVFLRAGLTQETLDDLASIDACEAADKPRLLLLENVRFHDQETNYRAYGEDDEARVVINAMGDFYVNDAFGCAHRDHLSICGVQTVDRAYGYLMAKEMAALRLLTENAEGANMLAIIGGAKVHDKLALIEALSKKMNDVYIAGGNVNNLLKEKMCAYLGNVQSHKAAVHVMHDGYCGQSFKDGVVAEYSTGAELASDKYFFDIGPQSMVELAKLIEVNDIIFWNGTLGVVEHGLYCGGSKALMMLLIQATAAGKKVIIGGGDTAGFANKFAHRFYYVSTGGGASIEYISEGSLVGIDYFKRA